MNATSSRKQLNRGTRCVIINQQNNTVWANLYVNARYHHVSGQMVDGDITLERFKGKTMRGAQQWAEKALAR